jgi:hypothetical protein
MSISAIISKGSRFDRALATVESLPTEDQAMLVEVIAKRVSAKRRQQMVREVAHARKDYQRGRVRRGSAVELMREARAK